MLLEKIIHFDDLTEYSEIPQYTVNEIVIDSRIAREGTVFVCLRGSFSDGHDFAFKAYLNGCRCFVSEKPLNGLPADAIVLVVNNTREMLAKMACRFYDNPSSKLKIIGLTGTKGKTTTALMITHVMNSCGLNCGYIGSNGVFFNNSWYKTQNTTPESLLLQKHLYDMQRSGVEYVALEVSSQELYTYTVDGVCIDTVVYTNLGHDHIGKFEHPDYEHYINSKAHLFDNSFAAVRCCRNVDDTMTERVTGHFENKKINYSLKGNGDVNSDNIRYYQAKNILGVMFDINVSGKTYPALIPMVGDFNVLNATCAFSVCMNYISDYERITDALSTVKIDGRFEMYHAPNGAVFVIDYAHNGLSLSCALEELRKFCRGRLICLFGSVGGRTENRREELGQAAGFYSDYCIVTSDNPNYEDPDKIINDILYHVKLEKCPWSAVTDRKEAIELAYGMAKDGDIVLLAGKGHESYQLINGIKAPFSERLILSELIKKDQMSLARKVRSQK